MVFSYEIENCSVIWAIRDEHISTNFLDEPAARFFLEKIQNKKETEKLAEKRLKFELDDQSKGKDEIRLLHNLDDTLNFSTALIAKM